MIDYEAGEPCGVVCGIPRSAHQTEEHPWEARSTSRESEIRAAILSEIQAALVLTTTSNLTQTRKEATDEPG